MAITLAQIVAEAKELVDEAGVDDDHVADAQWYIWANKAQRKLWRICYKHNPHMLLVSTDVTIASGSTSTSIPTGMVRLFGVERDPTTARRHWLKPINPFNKNSGQLRERRFWRDKTTIKIESEENAPGNYRIWYIASPTDMVISSVDLEVPLEPFWDYLPLRMAMKFCTKDNRQPHPALVEDWKEEIDDIVDTITASNSALPVGIVDVELLGEPDPALLR